MLNSEQLELIDHDAHRAGPHELRWRAQQLRGLLGTLSDADADMREHAQALLLKIEHLAQQAQAHQAEPHDGATATPYLAPALVLPVARPAWPAQAAAPGVACACGAAAGFGPAPGFVPMALARTIRSPAR
jgi:hypothetical protein